MSSPDANIHDFATGVAANTVAQHQDAQSLVFYAGWFCPFVQRSWIALEEKGVPYQYKEVNPYKKEAHFLAINPKGLVPSAEVEGTALYESLVLNEFFEDYFPDSKPLLPQNPVEKARARIWIDFIAKTVTPSFMRVIMAQDPEAQKKLLGEFYEALKKLTEQVRGPYFLGEEFSLVDAAIAPWVVRDYVAAEHRGYSREAAGPEWVHYAAALETRPSVVKTSSNKQYYTQIYTRYLKDEAQSEGAKAIRQGRAF